MQKILQSSKNINMVIINPWNKKSLNHRNYEVGSGQLNFTIGDYCIYKQSESSYLYTYKNLAFNNLAGFNLDHLKAVATRTLPVDEQQRFLYQRALETLSLYDKYHSNEYR